MQYTYLKSVLIHSLSKIFKPMFNYVVMTCTCDVDYKLSCLWHCMGIDFVLIIDSVLVCYHRDVELGDTVTIGQCRPLSKTVRYNVIKHQKSKTAKKKFQKFWCWHTINKYNRKLLLLIVSYNGSTTIYLCNFVGCKHHNCSTLVLCY